MSVLRLSVLLLVATACTSALAQLQYVPLQTPCRAVDTRQSGGAIAGGTVQVFDPGPACGIASQGSQPIAFAMNVTVVPHGGLNYLTVWGTGSPQPLASTLNSYDGRVKSDYAIVLGGANTGNVSVFASNTTDLILDVSGYFIQAPITGPAMLYTPVTPCRLLDTRNSAGPLGGPSLIAEQPRTFSLAGQCGLPDLSSGGVLSVNVTAVPKGGLGYLTLWGTSETDNNVPATSTLNAPTGTVVANAAFVTINPSTGTSISALANNDTDLVVDVNGYFSTGTTGMAYYPEPVPKRWLDTRDDNGLPFSAMDNLFLPTEPIYVLNATVVPTGPLWYLTIFPEGISLPQVSTLNSWDATVTSNMAIVGSGADGSFNAYADGTTQLILDLSGVFRPYPAAAADPVVEFVGDEISAGLVAASGNPQWRCDDCQTGATSATALAGFPAVIALHPDVIHILVGMYDLPAPGYEQVCGAQGVICTNIESMIQQAQAANIPVIIGTLPEYGRGPLATVLAGTLNENLINGNEDAVNNDIRDEFGSGVAGPGAPPGQGLPLIDYATANIARDNGIDPNAAGYAVMLPLVEAATAKLTPKVVQGATEAHFALR
jgi:lysophospholipase L1-like esterase